MFSRLHAAEDGREGGYAAANLAAVAFIAAGLVLAAVGYSLMPERRGSQQDDVGRETEWRAQTESAVKNAATAMESWGIENGGVYTGACGGASSTTCAAFDVTAEAGPNNRLVDNGLRLPPGVHLTVVRADAGGYCLLAHHESLPGYELYFASETGAPSTEPCT